MLATLFREIGSLRSELGAEIGSLRSELARSMRSLMVWGTGLMTTLAGLAFTAGHLL